jgi:hypothetical protein
MEPKERTVECNFPSLLNGEAFKASTRYDLLTGCLESRWGCGGHVCDTQLIVVGGFLKSV